MENNFISPIFSKCIIRSTGEEVEIIDAAIEERGNRSNEDWVSYIDSNNIEHIKEPLNIQFDFKPITIDTWNKTFEIDKMPTTHNCRIFEVAKELFVKKSYTIDEALEEAKKFVDKINID